MAALRWMGRLVLLLLLLGLGSCAREETSSSPLVNQDPQVSTIPWNRPQKWEGQGMLGGFQGSQ